MDKDDSLEGDGDEDPSLLLEDATSREKKGKTREDIKVDSKKAALNYPEIDQNNIVVEADVLNVNPTLNGAIMDLHEWLVDSLQKQN